MPSNAHELPLDMVRRQPRLALELLRTVAGIPVPDTAAVSLGSECYPETDPAEFRCDAAVMVGEPEPILGIVVENQLRFSKRKTFTWPVYLAALRARRECDVTLLVFCPDAATARACAKPIRMGHPRWTLHPLTFAPQDLPPVTDPGKARRLPELAVLSAPAHADGPDAEAVLSAYCEALQDLPTDIAAKYRDYAESLFSESASKLLEEIVSAGTYEYTSKFALHYLAEGEARGEARGEAKGEARGEAKALILVLDSRGIDLSEEQRERIATCTDSAQLELWLGRAATVESADLLFA